MPTESDRMPYEVTVQEIDFIDKVSLHYQSVYYVPHIAARILGLLLLTPNPITMEEITRALKASHGSISTNLRLLTLMGYVERLRPCGERAATFRFLPHSPVIILHDRISHYRELKQLIKTHPCQSALPHESSRRMDEMITWSELAIRKLSEFIVEWEDFIKRR